jgi:hypothetical protein
LFKSKDGPKGPSLDAPAVVEADAGASEGVSEGADVDVDVDVGAGVGAVGSADSAGPEHSIAVVIRDDATEPESVQ